MIYKIGAIVAAALVAVVVAFVADIGPFAPSVSERASSRLGADVDCSRAGLTDLAGERETYYRCSGHLDPEEGKTGAGEYVQTCVAVVDGRVYTVDC